MFREPFARGILLADSMMSDPEFLLLMEQPVAAESPADYETMHGAVTLQNFLDKFDTLEARLAAAAAKQKK